MSLGFKQTTVFLLYFFVSMFLYRVWNENLQWDKNAIEKRKLS